MSHPVPRIKMQFKECFRRLDKTGNVHINNIKARSCYSCCSGKAVSITYSECVSVVLVTKHAKRMRHVILSSVACLAPP